GASFRPKRKGRPFLSRTLPSFPASSLPAFPCSSPAFLDVRRNLRVCTRCFQKALGKKRPPSLRRPYPNPPLRKGREQQGVRSLLCKGREQQGVRPPLRKGREFSLALPLLTKEGVGGRFLTSNV